MSSTTPDRMLETRAPVVEFAATNAVLDLFAPSGWVDPHRSYAALRQHSPVYPISSRSVLVTGYDACSEVLLDPRRYHVPDMDYADRALAGWRDHPAVVALYNILLYQNPPDNLRARRLLLRMFTGANVVALRSLFERHAAAGADLEPREQDGIADATHSFTTIPNAIIAELCGIPQSDIPFVFSLLDSAGFAYNPHNPPDPGLATANAKAEQLDAYIRNRLLPSGRRGGGSIVADLARDWPAAEEDGLAGTVAFLFAAGAVTTVSLLGAGILALTEQPDLLPRLRTDDALLASFVQEIVRYDPPVQLGTRFAVADTTLHGMHIPQDTTVLVCYGALGRDPAHFAEPDTFRADRFLAGGADPRRILSFSTGTHRCVGAAFALSVAEAAFRALAQRYDRVRLAAPPQRENSSVVRTFTSLEVVAEPRRK
ncbi:cytochrome P450 [Nocardia sp. BMG111209]|uniref:cytochrome P450 n=1 Tax=Nocardia sp. BMG111209 TaxID=1160137 RepID=UPI0009DBE085|nr:cytochrome P450 [Nocardia sp. BMG111209]